MTLTLLPLLIFVAEVCVVTISTVRIIFPVAAAKSAGDGDRHLRGEHLDVRHRQPVMLKPQRDPFCYVAFAKSGFAIGNYLGVVIEQKLA